MSGVYIGGVFTGGTVRQFAEDGTTNWTVNNGTSICATDGNGNLYASAAGGVVKKYDIDGVEVWSRTYHTTTIQAIAVDADENVFVCGNRSSSVTHRKWDPDGTKIWEKDFLTTLYAIAIDTDGNSYFGGNPTSPTNTIISHEPDGTERWRANTGGDTIVRTLATDADGNLYVGHDRNSSSPYYTHRKYNNSGTLQWSKDHGANVRGCCVSAAGYIYFCGVRTSSKTTRQYSADGTENWSRDYHGNALSSISVDSDENAYVSGSRTSSISARKYNSSGTEIWTADCGATAPCCRAFVTPRTDIIPALSIPLGLATPGAGFYIVSPALAIPLGLALPTVTPMPTPPDLSDRAAAALVYRAYLTGDSRLLELPARSIQCIRRLADSTSLDVVVPGYTADLETDIAARLAAGAELVVYAGVRSASGIETTGQFMRAALTEYRYERDGYRGEFRLLARAVADSHTPVARNLPGVVGRGKSAGKWFARCAIDFTVLPGDTVHDGVRTWTAGTIRYAIQSGTAELQVEES